MADEKDKLQAEAMEALTTEQTKSQRHRGFTMQAVVGNDSILTVPSIPSGTYNLYRLMSKQPTMAIAYVTAIAPIKTAEWGVTADKNAPAGAEDFIKMQVDKVWDSYIDHAVSALKFGWAPFEPIFQAERVEGTMRIVCERLKPLLVDKSKLLEEQGTGKLIGIVQDDSTKIIGPKALWFSNDPTPENPYGSSRYEASRTTAYPFWNDAASKMGMYGGKVAGIQPMVEYPEGDSIDQNGTTQANYTIAKTILEALTRGKGVAMPSTLAKFAEMLAHSGVDITDMRAWHIGFLEAKGKHGMDFIAMLKYWDSNMLRSWFVPERAVTEGQFGTKAEAEAHALIAVVVALIVLGNMITKLNEGFVDWLLEFNFGKDARGTVKVDRRSVNPEAIILAGEIITAILTNPQNTDIAVSSLNFSELFDMVGIPKISKDADLNKLIDGIEPVGEPDELGTGFNKPEKKENENKDDKKNEE